MGETIDQQTHRAPAGTDKVGLDPDGYATVDEIAARAIIPESQVTGLVADLALKAPIASPTFTGNPGAPTQSPGNVSTRIATTAFVDAAVTAGGGGGGGAVASVNGRTGVVDLSDLYGPAVLPEIGPATGAPTTGTHVLVELALALNGHIWKCTVAGTPGTWVDITPATGLPVGGTTVQFLGKASSADGDYSWKSTALLAQAGQSPAQEPVQGARTPTIGDLDVAARANHDHAFPLIRGAGPPTGVTAPKGFLYSNSTATTTTTRLYVNTDGGTTWTNLVTAA